MSGAQTSGFPNQNDLMQVATQNIANYYAPEKNRLLIQQGQQEVAGREMAAMASASQGLLSLGDEQKMAEEYPKTVAYLQSQGYAKNAPPTFPGKQALEMIRARGLTVPQQFDLGLTGSSDLVDQVNKIGTGTGPGARAESPVLSGDTQARAQAVHDGMVKRGWSDTAAWGFAANAVQESDALPNPKPGDGGQSHGVFQWNGDRLAAFQAKYGVLPGQATLDQQLDFANDELGGSEKGAADAIRNATTLGQAAAVISSGYLRPLDVAGEQVRRAGIASRLTQGLNAGGVAAQPATTTAARPAPAVTVPAAPNNRLLPAIGGGPAGGGMVGIDKPMSGGTPDVLGALEPEQPAPTQFAGPGVPLPPPPSTTGGFVGPGLEGGSAGNVLGGLISAPPPAPAPTSPQPQPTVPPPATGLNSPQMQQVQTLLDQRRQAAALAARNPKDIRLQAAAKAKIDDIDKQISVLTTADVMQEATRDGIHGQVNVRTGEFKPDPARRITMLKDGTVINDQGQVIRAAPTGDMRPPTADFDIRNKQWEMNIAALNADRPKIEEITQSGQASQNAMIRFNEMANIIPQLATGPGGDLRTKGAALLESMGASPDTIKRFTGMASGSMAEELIKLSIATAGQAAKTDVGSNNGIQSLQLYQSANPGMALLPDANKRMTNMARVAQQMSQDYTQGALAHFNPQQKAVLNPSPEDLQAGRVTYAPISNYNQAWQQRNNPQIGAAAMGILNGDNFDKWAARATPEQAAAAVAMAARIDPNVMVPTPDGPKPASVVLGHPLTPAFR